MSIEYSAFESGLDRFVKLDEGSDFIGPKALIEWQEPGVDNAFVTLEVTGNEHFDVRGAEPIHLDGELVRRCTSGNFGPRTGKSLALAMVRPELAAVGTELEVAVLGERFAARVVGESPFDPENVRLRGRFARPGTPPPRRPRSAC